MSSFCFIISKYWDYKDDSYRVSAFKELEFFSPEIYVLVSEKKGTEF